MYNGFQTLNFSTSSGCGSLFPNVERLGYCHTDMTRKSTENCESRVGDYTAIMLLMCVGLEGWAELSSLIHSTLPVLYSMHWLSKLDGKGKDGLSWNCSGLQMLVPSTFRFIQALLTDNVCPLTTKANILCGHGEHQCVLLADCFVCEHLDAWL